MEGVEERRIVPLVLADLRLRFAVALEYADTHAVPRAWPVVNLSEHARDVGDGVVHHAHRITAMRCALAPSNEGSASSSAAQGARAAPACARAPARRRRSSLD